MREAVIASVARTGIGKAFRGSLNKTHGATMTAHVIKHAVERAKIDPAEVEDVVIGCGLPEGATGHNVGRVAALHAGLPITTSGMTVNRYCSSGLQSVSIAAQRIIADNVEVMVAGGVESISLVHNSASTRTISSKIGCTRISRLSIIQCCQRQKSSPNAIK
jgi:acetyl-CoA C-acetyltransferase